MTYKRDGRRKKEICPYTSEKVEQTQKQVSRERVTPNVIDELNINFKRYRGM